MTTRTLSPGEYHAELRDRLAAARSKREPAGRAYDSRAAGRKPARRLIGSLVVFMTVFALSAMTVLGTHDPIDMTTAGTSETYGGAIFTQGPLVGSAGTGVIDPFIRVDDNDGDSEGYNTNFRPLEFDEDNPWTEALLLSTLPQFDVGGTIYRKFNLDINETAPGTLLSLDEIQVYLGDGDELHDFDPDAETFGAGGTATQVWDLDDFDGGHDQFVKLNYILESGSGDADMTLLIPDSLFTGAGAGDECDYGQDGCGLWVYLYSFFGAQTGMTEQAGFEEWNTDILPFVRVEKTVTATFDRTITWDIDKSVSPDEWDLFRGDSGTSEYTVMVDKTVTDGNASLTGTITISVPETLPDGDKAAPTATVETVTDIWNGESATVTCPGGLPQDIDPGDSLVCTYELEPTSVVNGEDNVASVTIEDNPTTFTDEVPVNFTANTIGYETINVTDTIAGSLGSFSDDGSATPYTDTFTCDADEGDHTNTATIVETGQTAQATVTVNCHELTVTKTTDESWVRTFNWTIEKSATPTAAEIFENDVQEVDYEIDVTKNVGSDAFGVTGSITVDNSTPIDAVLNSVSDVVSPAIAASVDCGLISFPYTLASGDDLECTYSAALPDSTTRTNTATATLQNYAYDKDLNGTASGTTNFTGTEQVVFPSEPTGTVGDTASVDDVQTGDAGLTFSCIAGTCSWPQAVDDSDDDFSYTKELSSDTAGVYDLDDTATITFTGGSDDDSETVTLTVVDVDVTKTAVPSWERTYDWTVDKSVDPTSLTIEPGMSGVLNYTITATKTAVGDAYGVSGVITITNNNTSKSAVITSLTDVADGINATITDVDCSIPITILPGASVMCDYSASGLPDADGTNTATAVNDNRRWDADGSEIVDLTLTGTSYQGSQAYLLTEPSSEIDESATVNDPGIVCPVGFTCVPDYTSSGTPPWVFTDSGSKMFSVTVTAGAGVPCDTNFEVPNLVTLVESDTPGDEDTDDALATIYTGECPGAGCTPGFWQGGFGSTLWNEENDPDWTDAGGVGTNPFAHDTLFNDFFTDHSGLDGMTMLDVVGTGGGNQWYRKAARDVVAAYLNASFGIGYPYTTAQIEQMWTDAVNAGNNSGFMQIHADLGAANELGCTISSPSLTGFPLVGVPLGGLLLAAGRRFQGRRRAS